MDAIFSIAGIITLFAAARLAPRWLFADERPTDVPREWPRGVQEDEPVRWQLDRLAPRRAPGSAGPAATEPVTGPVVVAWH